MEETIEKTGFFGRISDGIATLFHREEEYEDDFELPAAASKKEGRLPMHRYHITVRRQIVSFQDAVAAADGLKRGEQQVLNISMCAPELREKVKDFMCGVNYTAEGSWEELGDNVYLLAPATAYVEVAPASQRMVAGRN